MSERHVCTACGKEIIGQSIAVKGEHYHQECFVCGKCKTRIRGQFKTQDGVRICLNCSPTQYCEVCKKAVSGTMLKVAGKVYHPECFKCEECGASLQSGVCNKGGKNLCEKCASAKGKVVNTCKKCKKEQQSSGASGVAVAGDWFCQDCFVCAQCSSPLPSSSFIIDPARRRAGEYACLCQECSRMKPEDTMESLSCLVCKQAAGTNAVRLLDGSVLHASCIKCKGCGSREVDKPAVLTLKVKSLKSGNYICSVCDQATEAELGTYGGKGKDGREDVTYCICLRQRHIFWLDYTSMNAVSTSSFHAEGKYTRTAKAGGGAVITLTVEMCPFGGGPKCGTTYTAELSADGKELLCQGVRCAKSAEAEAERQGGPGGLEAFSQSASPPRRVSNANTSASAIAKRFSNASATTAVSPDAKAPGPAPKLPGPAADEPQPALAPGQTLTLEQLKNAQLCAQHSVDPTAKEAFLAEADFASVFGCAREDFMKLPKWKRDRQKKEVGLF